MTKLVNINVNLIYYFLSFFIIIFLFLLVFQKISFAATCTMVINPDTYCSDTTIDNGAKVYSITYRDNSGVLQPAPAGTITTTSPATTCSSSGGSIVECRVYGAGKTYSNPTFTGGGATCAAVGSFTVNSCMLRPNPGVYKRVFLTKDVVLVSSFGPTGVLGADSICTSRAAAAGLGGDWAAWLSTSTVGAKDRITSYNYPYVQVSPVHEYVNLTDSKYIKIANNFTAFTQTNSTNLLQPINLMEDGTAGASNGNVVFTNTAHTGLPYYTTATQSCNDFTQATTNATRAGKSDNKNANFTQTETEGCDSTVARLYCFEK